MDDYAKQFNDKKKIRFKPNILGSNDKPTWILVIVVLSFFLSGLLLYLSSHILKEVSLFVSFLVVFGIIFVGIFFDTIGVAVAVADEKPFHAMASRKVYGAKQAITLIRNADRFATIFNDVVGDICSVISGTASAFIIIQIVGNTETTGISPVELILTGVVAGMTVGGKAIGKTIAIRHSNYITYKVSVVIKFLSSKTEVFRFKKIKRN